MVYKNAKELEMKIRKLCEEVHGTLCFFGSGRDCKKMLLWFRQYNLNMPVAICDNKAYEGEKIEGIPVISFEYALVTYVNLKILITSTFYGNDIEKQVKEKLNASSFVNIAPYFEDAFFKKNRLYIDSLRGLNKRKFSLLSPEDMPKSASEIVAQLKNHRELYEKNIDTQLDFWDPLIHGINIDFWTSQLEVDKKYSSLEFQALTSYNGVTKIGDNLDYLISFELGKPQDNINLVDNIVAFSSYLSAKNIMFLYVQIPNKLSTIENLLPEGYTDCLNLKTDEYLKKMTQQNVNLLDFRQVMKEQNLNPLHYFFKTDTHWTPRLAFHAANAIIDEFTKMGFTFDKRKCNLENYECITYPDILLGDKGWESGILFAGLDDFELILPKYETCYSWICEDVNFKKVGQIQETLLSPIHLDWCYNNAYPYGVYSLVHENYTIIKNELNKNLGKILVLCDSFSNPLSSFLAPHFSELHFLDLRGKFGKKELFDIIEQIHPDLVMMAPWVNTLICYPMTTDINPYKD